MKSAQAFQPPQQIGHVGAKYAPVDMQLIQDHPAQVAQQAGPVRVVRQDPHVQHVRIADQDPCRLANCGPVGRWGVTVIGPHRDLIGCPQLL